MSANIIDRVSVRALRGVTVNAELALKAGETIELDALTAGDVISGGRAVLVDPAADFPKVKAAAESVALRGARELARQGKSFSSGDFGFVGRLQ